MKRSTLSIAAALVFVGAQAQQTTPPVPPSTSQTEGTATDRTPPGETPTQGAARAPESTMPGTNPAEGTATDRAPPGHTTTQSGATQRDAQRDEIVGAPVVSSSDAPLGEVVDVVFDAANRPEFVVIQSEGKSMAMPYSAASSMKKADKIIVEEARLEAAPKVEQGAWRNPVSSRWRQESTRYWGRG